MEFEELYDLFVEEQADDDGQVDNYYFLDWLDKSNRNISDTAIEKLWCELDDVLIDDDDPTHDCVLEYDWRGWTAGTDRETIWHWFDRHHSKGVYYLLYEYNRRY